MSARISGRAESDLDCIYAGIYARRGAQSADRFLQKAFEAAEFLVQHPLAGPHPSWATRHKTLRYWVISGTNYLIYYIVEERGISLERVLDGRRDVRRILELGREDPSD